MLRIRHIDSFDLPELRPYRTMRRQEEQRREGIFVAEGEKVVRRLLESDLTPVSVLLPEKWLRELREMLERRPETLDVFVAEKKLLETLTGFSMYQGLLAIGKVPPARLLDEILAAAAKPVLLLAAEGLSNAENMGVLARNSAAFGAGALISGETCASPYLRRAVRSSMGAVFHLPVIETGHLVGLLKELRDRGIRCTAAHPHASGRRLSQAQLTGPSCIVFGSEGYGLSGSVLDECDDAVAIPMSPMVDSLNIGSAAAAFLYEAARQRGSA